jgi:hypothetical protein
VQGVGGAVRGRELACSAGARGEAVEAALEEFVVGFGEGKILWGGRLVYGWDGKTGGWREGTYGAHDTKAELDVAPDGCPAVDPAEVGDGEAEG